MARQMKDSGVEWIGEMPVEWSKDKLCRVCSLIGSGTTPKFDRFDLSSAKIPWIQSGDLSTAYIYRTKTNVTRDIIESHSALKVYEAPFIVVAMYGASIGNTSISNIDACVNQACCVLAPRKSNLRYLYYAITACKPYFMYQGEGGGQPNISQEKIRQTRIPLPNLLEQQEISIRLDTKCAEIDKVVEQTRATIEEYKKLKQAIITEAVTKGVRGARPMKPSGVEWIGDIPEDWSMKRFKYLGIYRNGLTYKPEDMVDMGTLVLRSSNIQNGQIVLDDNVYVSCAVRDELKVRKGDILICSRNGSRELIGKNAIIKDDMDASFGAFMMIFRSDSPEYVRYILNSSVFSYYLASFFTATINQLTASNFGNMKVPFCCDLIEQKEIVAFLDTKCAEIDRIIEKKEQLIEKLGSYKKSLIYEYVTGKKEVTQK